MDRLRNRLIVAFVVATLLPLGATIWIASSLIERSLGYAATDDLDRLSRTLESTVRQFYQRERDALRQDASDGRLEPVRFEAADRSAWPAPVREFWLSGEPERVATSGEAGDRLELMRREADGVALYRRSLGAIHLAELSAELARTRELVAAFESRDLRRGFTLTLLLLIAVVWIVSLVPIVLIAHRISRPIQQLTAALTDFAGGDWNRRLPAGGRGEIGRAVNAFNHMADRARQDRDRLVYLTQMSSWQSLARKMAHELKNSLTPIRLTVEEMLARQPGADRAFMAEATGIVVAEIEALERRVRAFSEFAADPPVTPQSLDVNALVVERVALLRAACPGTRHELKLDERRLCAWAGVDQVNSILTNLLANAAEAAGPDGTVLVRTRAAGASVVIEVHDSGPGLSPDAAATLFEPTITFKKHGMGLGLSIARKNALVCGGDITLVPGELGGAGFRVALPGVPKGSVPHLWKTR